MVVAFVRFSKLYHGFFGSVLAGPPWGIFCSPKRKFKIPDKYQGGEGGEGCVGRLEFDWAINKTESKAIK